MRFARKIGKIFSIIFILFFLLTVLFVVANMIFSPYWDSVYAPSGYISFNSMNAAESDEVVYTKEQATDDLMYIAKCLKRVHPSYKSGLPQNVNECLDREIDSFGESVSSYELWHSVAHILHSTGDSNCIVVPSFSRRYLTDYLNKIDSGYELQKINDLFLNEIFEKNSDLFSYELEAWGMNCLTECCQTLEGLKFLGFDVDNLKFTYISPQGNSVVEAYTSADFVDYDTAADLLNPSYSEILPYETAVHKENNFGMVTINSSNFDVDYKELLYAFFGEITEKNIENVVVDLRNNSVGTSFVADEFVLYMTENRYFTPGGCWRLGPYVMEWDSQEQTINHYDEIQFDGDVYVLTSSKTFSSGTLFAEIIQENGFGTIVGEPCGSKPDCYDDPVVFQTPNSLLSFQVSSKHYNHLDTSKSAEPLVPDIECESDMALDKVISIINSD